VQVLFLQTAGTDRLTKGPLADPSLLAAFLTQAHRFGIRVVGWYLPTLANRATDLRHLQAIANFRAGSQRFDGVAVDIEDTTTVTDLARRNDQLVRLSTELRTAVGPSYPLAAIVLPPVLTEVINRQSWPNFPWRKLAPLYNVWVPMAFWTFRSTQSPYHNPTLYTTDSVTRLRRDLGDPSAAVEVLGGLSDSAAPSDYPLFVEGAAEARAVGLSVFSYRYLDPAELKYLQQAVPPLGFDRASGTLHE
ncbi:MAG: hypothetical protein ACYCS7_04770, partial [Acidimicrobiales bacterium]